MSLEKIVSGGQTGVDRGALDAALMAQFPCGGWCPADRSAEDGPIPVAYPLAPLPGARYRERTRKNVIDSDGTLILFDGRLTGGKLTGGTELTAQVAKERRKPVFQVDAARSPVSHAATAILAWVNERGIEVLNVAGPRASGWAQGHEYARQVIAALIEARSAAGRQAGAAARNP
jgi:hypothetical protein